MIKAVHITSMGLFLGIPLLSLLIFCSCEAEYNLDLPDQTEIVALSNFSPDSTFKIFITTTSSLTNPTNNSIPSYPANAMIQLSEDGNPIGPFEFIDDALSGAPFYRTNHIPKQGVQYDLNIAVPGLKEISSSGSIPKAIPIQETKVLSLNNVPDPDYPETVQINLKARLRLSQEIKASDKFHFIAWQDVTFYDLYYYPDTTFFTFRQYFGEGFNQNIISEIEINDILHEKGVLLKGSEIINLPDGIEVDFSFTYDEGSQIKTPIYLEFRTVSEDYFSFHESIGIQEQTGIEQSILASEPIFIHNNINNGIGNFSGYQAAIDSIFWR